MCACTVCQLSNSIAISNRRIVYVLSSRRQDLSSSSKQKNIMVDPSLDDDERSSFVVFVVLFSFFLLVLVKAMRNSLKIVHQAEVMIVERFGKYQRTLKPGIHWIWPIIESPRMINWRYMNVENNSSEAHIVSIVTDRVDMREHVIDFGKQHVITKDTGTFSFCALRLSLSLSLSLSTKKNEFLLLEFSSHLFLQYSPNRYRRPCVFPRVRSEISRV